MQETWVRSLRGEDALEKGMATHSSVLAWRIHGQMSLLGYSPWGLKELDTTEQLSLTPGLTEFSWSPNMGSVHSHISYCRAPKSQTYTLICGLNKCLKYSICPTFWFIEP